jgi:hypothetical protein
MTAYRIEEGLEGMTPYAVSELVYDWRAFETDRVKLAVVARETLDEARGFAEGHGFKPAGFAAMPPQERFPACRSSNWRSAKGMSFPDDGIAFGPDTFGQEPEERAAEDRRGRTRRRPTGPEAGRRGHGPDQGGEAAKARPLSRKSRRPQPEPETEPEPEPEPEPDPEARARRGRSRPRGSHRGGRRGARTQPDPGAPHRRS